MWACDCAWLVRRLLTSIVVHLVMALLIMTYAGTGLPPGSRDAPGLFPVYTGSRLAPQQSKRTVNKSCLLPFLVPMQCHCIPSLLSIPSPCTATRVIRGSSQSEEFKHPRLVRSLLDDQTFKGDDESATDQAPEHRHQLCLPLEACGPISAHHVPRHHCHCLAAVQEGPWWGTGGLGAAWRRIGPMQPLSHTAAAVAAPTSVGGRGSMPARAGNSPMHLKSVDADQFLRKGV